MTQKTALVEVTHEMVTEARRLMADAVVGAVFDLCRKHPAPMDVALIATMPELTGYLMAKAGIVLASLNPSLGVGLTDEAIMAQIKSGYMLGMEAFQNAPSSEVPQ